MRPPTAGDVLVDRFVLQGQLAAGSNAAVWLAHDRVLFRTVVLKHRRTTAFHGGLHAGLAEARAAAAVRNPHVVLVHDVIADPVDGAWIVMEALEGESLAFSIARTGGLPPPTVATVAAALTDALAALHGAGVVHGDVKPSNVQLCRDGRVVLLDLGVAAGGERSGPHPSHVVAGTLEYLAPELVVDTATSERVDPYACDLYALGVTLFCAVEGVVPFRLSCVQELVDHANDPPPPPTSSRAAGLGPLLTGLLQPRPADRWGIDGVRRHLSLLSSSSADLRSVS